MMLAAANRRIRVLLLEPGLLTPERTAESILGRLADASGTRPLLVCLAGAGESVERLLQDHPVASAAFQQPFDIERVGARIEELLHDEVTAMGRILVVDADHREASDIAATLRQAGLRPEQVADASQIRAALERLEPDLVILDLNLPWGGARSVTEAIRDHGRFHDLPIVFLSADQGPDRQSEVLSLGDEDFLARPILAEQLVTAVQRRMSQVLHPIPDR
jgi:PleD family two-component response regulator